MVVDLAIPARHKKDIPQDTRLTARICFAYSAVSTYSLIRRVRAWRAAEDGSVRPITRRPDTLAKCHQFDRQFSQHELT